MALAVEKKETALTRFPFLLFSQKQTLAKM